MKKFITFLFLFICMLGLVSCKEKNTKQPEENKQEEKTKENEEKPAWPESSIQSYCDNNNALPAFTDDYKEIKTHEENGNLCIDMDNVTEAGYSNYCKALLADGYTSNNFPTYEKTFNGFSIQVSVFFNPESNELSLQIKKIEIIADWPTKQLSDAIGEEACLALPVFAGPYDYDFTSNEWFTTLSIKGKNIGETYNSYIDELKTKYIVYEDFNEPSYKEYRFSYLNSNYDITSFDLIYDGSKSSVSISMSCEKFEPLTTILPNSCHLTFNLEWGKTLDIYKNGDDYVFVNYSSKYKVEAYTYNSTEKTYNSYSGEGSDLNSIVLNKGEKLNYKDCMDILKDYLYDDRATKALKYELDAEKNDTIASIPCEAHIGGSYFYYVDPSSNLLCKLCTNDYVFRELALFENTCTFPVELPQ